ncbi:MAG: ribonuclease HII [Candidatus Pacebacteria bacterium]|nr:ribonuclease HII [Candidatus Paceibacterota bacterium]
MNLKTEKYYWQKGFQVIIGLDEAGRGPLAGPITAAAVIVNPKAKIQSASWRNKPKINLPVGSKSQDFMNILKGARDSKKLSPKQREKIFELIQKSPYIKFTHSSVGPKTIDRINIEKANQKAMQNCLKKILSNQDIKNKKILILIDGNQKIPLDYFFLKNDYFFLKNKKIFQKAVIKGDNKIFSIALSSIVAKVTRDKKMNALSLKYPQYKFSSNKGYGTELHRQLLKKYGPCEIHRKSFKLHR